MLTAWTISLIYVGSDLTLRLGVAAQFGVLARVGRWITEAVWLQILVFILGLPLVWLLCFLADLGIAAARGQSWLFRVGDLAHSRVFLSFYLAALLMLGALALQYEVTFSSFWLIFGLLLISCLVGFIEPGVDWPARFRESRDRLTLLLIRIPFLRDYISPKQVNDRLEQEQATSAAEESGSPQPPDPPSPDQHAT